MKTGIKYFIVGSYVPQTGKIGTLWLVTTVQNDRYKSGDSIPLNGKEYVLGKRDIDDGTVSSYELILKTEVLEL